MHTRPKPRNKKYAEIEVSQGIHKVPISDFINGSNTTHVLSCTIPYNIQVSYVITGMTFDNSGFLYMYDANAKNWTGSGSQRAVLKFKPMTMPDPATLEIHFYPGLTITGTVGGAYRIDYSESLEAENWIPLTTITLPSSPYTFSDYTAIHAPKRFYRAVGLP